MILQSAHRIGAKPSDVVDIGNNSRCKAYSRFDGATLDKSCKVSQYAALSQP